MKTTLVVFLFSLLLFVSCPEGFAAGALSTDNSEIISIGPSGSLPVKPPAKDDANLRVSNELLALRKTAAAGNPEDQLELGRALLSNRYGVGNPVEAVRWIEKAADQNFLPARTELGRMHREGIGVPKNYFEAIRHFRTAADAGFQRARLELGYMYFQGKGVHQDALEAYVLLNLASPSLQLAPETELLEERTALLILEKKLTPDQKELAQERMLEAREQSLADLMKRYPGKPGQPPAPLEDRK